MSYSITGIQQVGIGVDNMEEAWRWYRKQFGMDVPIFRDAGEATLMAPYTGGAGQKRTAVLAASLHGGGAFEVWQFTERTPAPPLDEFQIGDLGVNAVIVKSRDIDKSFDLHRRNGIAAAQSIARLPNGLRAYGVRDPYGNSFFIEESDEVFLKTTHSVGGIKAALVGVSDIEKARRLYGDVLGYTEVVFDQQGVFEDFSPMPGGASSFRRVRLAPKESRKGGLSRLFGSSYVELVQATDRVPVKIFRDRYWGDKGFIHLCFDVYDTESLKKACEDAGFSFTVDSQDSFDMGEAAGRFAYAEDPDGTLIEFVEAFKMPLLKKIGWYLDLRKRDPDRPLPDWMLKTLRFSRVKDRD
jgi:catechol 2,3-dioxygenase-like lactoylglutathione lyase family enzyme